MTRDDLKNQIIDYLAGKLTCKEVTEAITDYLEGRLSFGKWVRFQMHLGLCFGCRRYLRLMCGSSASSGGDSGGSRRTAPSASGSATTFHRSTWPRGRWSWA